MQTYLHFLKQNEHLNKVAKRRSVALIAFSVQAIKMRPTQLGKPSVFGAQKRQSVVFVVVRNDFL